MKHVIFKAGDKVRCVDANQSMLALEHGKEYEVTRVAPGGGRVYLKETSNLDWYAHRFELVN